MGMTVMDREGQNEIYNIINDIKQRIKLQESIDEDKKDKLIELFYEFDGNYSTKRSFYHCIGGVKI